MGLCNVIKLSDGERKWAFMLMGVADTHFGIYLGATQMRLSNLELWVSVLIYKVKPTVNRQKYNNLEIVNPKESKSERVSPPNTIRRLSARRQVTQSTNETSVKFKAYSGGKRAKKSTALFM